jgi:hypothetical protein
VGVAPVAAQNAEQDRAHDVVGPAATVAHVVKGAFAEKLLPPPARLEELEKEDQLALAGDGGLIVPLGMKASARGVQRP